jgi:hypothetical protein
LVIIKRLLWAGTLVAAWQFLGGSKISEPIEPAATAIGTVADQITHRRIYQHSVIPGGVYSGLELARARRTDPVVAAHYGDFGSDTRLVRLSQDELVYVSYRKANKVFWTKKKHRVCEGEAVLTDGKNNVARARCGNRLSKTPKLPTDKTEPPQSALDTPRIPSGSPDSGAGPLEATNLPLPGLDPFPPTLTGAAPRDEPSPLVSSGASKEVLPPPAGFFPSVSPVFGSAPLVPPSLVVGPTGGAGGSTTGTGGTSTGGTTTTGGTTGTGSGTTTVPTIVATPEPGSLVLVVAGGAALCLLRRKRRGFSN